MNSAAIVQKHWNYWNVLHARGGPAPGLRVGEASELRLCERWTSSAKSVFLFDVNGSVAKSTYVGILWLKRLPDAEEKGHQGGHRVRGGYAGARINAGRGWQKVAFRPENAFSRRRKLRTHVCARPARPSSNGRCIDTCCLKGYDCRQKSNTIRRS